MGNSNGNTREPITSVPHDIIERGSEIVHYLVDLYPHLLDGHEIDFNHGRGGAFAAYVLCVADVTQPGRNLIERFKTAYVVTYYSKQAIFHDAKHHLEGNHHPTAAEMEETDEIRDTDLPPWITDVIWDRLESAFTIVDTGLEVYLFRKTG